jgi:SAM-dependent methyltransferase
VPHRGEVVTETDVCRRWNAFRRYFAEVQKLDAAYAETASSGSSRHHEVSRKIFELSVPFLESLPPVAGKTVLDVGLGYGHHCAWFAAQGADVVGISTHLSPFIQKHARDHGYDVREMDMHFLDMADGSVDLVWSHHSLEHSFSPLFALREWLRVLKANGRLAVTVPPHKQEVVSGHFNAGWSVGQLLYLLGVAGYSVRDGRFLQEGYNVRACVQRPAREADLSGLSWMCVLEPYLPKGVRENMHAAPGSLGQLSFDGAIARLEGASIDMLSSEQPVPRDESRKSVVGRVARLLRRK